MFLEKGFEGASTREIAARAEVGRGTLFVYARDKQDLLLMLVNDDLDAITASATDGIRANAPLASQLVAFFRPRYEYWATAPELARAAMRVMGGSYLPGAAEGELARGLARRAQVVGALSTLVARAEDAGARLRGDRETACWLFYDIYLTELRLWLNEQRPSVRTGLSRLERLFSLALDGAALPSRKRATHP